MKMILPTKRFYYQPKKLKGLVEVVFTIDTDKIERGKRVRIRNMLKKGWGTTSRRSGLGMVLYAMAEAEGFPFIFFSASRTWPGMYLMNVPDKQKEQVKKYIQNLLNVVGDCTIEDERYAWRGHLAIRDNRKNKDRAPFEAAKAGLRHYADKLMTEEQRAALDRMVEQL